MILKIMREDDFQEWWKLDEIRQLSLSKVYYRGGQTELDHDIYLLDFVPKCECSLLLNDNNKEIRCPACGAYMVLSCVNEQGKSFTIAFDTTAYVMNDNGKTLDRIVVQY